MKITLSSRGGATGTLTKHWQRLSIYFADLFKHYQSYSLITLIAVYLLCHAPFLIALRNFTSAIIPLNTLYMANTLLFKNGGLSDAVAQMVISPSNAFLIYPPGIYILIKSALRNVKDIYIFLFAIQLFVPVFTFIFFSKVTKKTYAFVIAIMAIYFFTDVNWWAPDYIIQPIMLAACLLLMNFIYGKNITIWRMASIGFLTGIIIVFKHNIGIFFAIMCGTVIFFKSVEDSVKDLYSNDRFRILLFSVPVFFLLFGVFFADKLIYFDEFIFYLLPYFAFWVLTICIFWKTKTLNLNAGRFFKNALVYILFLLPLPVMIFLWIGCAVGYLRYWNALFGMGFQYLPIWDHGICSTILTYVRFKDFSSIANLAINMYSVIALTCFILPFFVNCASCLSQYGLLKNRKVDTAEAVKHLTVTSTGIIAIFMFFPLEGSHILYTKLFLFLYLFLYIFKRPSFMPNIFKIFLIFAITMGSLHALSDLYWQFNTRAIRVSGDIQNRIGLPVNQIFAEEISKQIDVIHASVKNNAYFIIDSSGMTLTSLLSLVDNRYAQYYVDMRKGILCQEVVNAVISELRDMPFVIVNLDDYRKYQDDAVGDKYLKHILRYVKTHFSVVGTYEKPQTELFKNNFCSFLVLKNNGSALSNKGRLWRE